LQEDPEEKGDERKIKDRKEETLFY